jgi:hypothetical protein
MVAQLDTNGIISGILNRLNGWTLALTILLGLVAYDQCKLCAYAVELANTDHAQSSTSGTRAPLSAPPGKRLLSDPSSSL